MTCLSVTKGDTLSATVAGSSAGYAVYKTGTCDLTGSCDIEIGF